MDPSGAPLSCQVLRNTVTKSLILGGTTVILITTYAIQSKSVIRSIVMAVVVLSTAVLLPVFPWEGDAIIFFIDYFLLLINYYDIANLEMVGWPRPNSAAGNGKGVG